MVQLGSKVIVIIAAAARNGVIGRAGKIPWHLPADFAHFKRSTLHSTLLMGRATFDSIGRPLPYRDTIVLTRDRAWSHPGIRVAHDLQGGLDVAETLPGDVMVAGGSHIYAELLPHAQMQVLSEVDAEPEGDAFYPHWDRREWLLGESKKMDGFTIAWWHRKPMALRDFEFRLPSGAADAWWNSNWSARLARAVRDQRAHSADPCGVDWNGIHCAAMRIIIEAAEEQVHPVSPRREGARSDRRIVKLGDHLSMQDIKEIQGALFHWSDYLAPRHQLS